MASKKQNRGPVAAGRAAKVFHRSDGTFSKTLPAPQAPVSGATGKRLSVCEGRVCVGYIERVGGGWQIVSVRGERSRIFYRSRLRASRALPKGGT